MVNVISGVVDGIGKRSVLRRIPIGSIFVRRLAKRLAGQPVTVRTVQRTEKTENAPRLYDLTALQREANRSLGYTAQQALDYLQALYEKKLCTYPPARTAASSPTIWKPPCRSLQPWPPLSAKQPCRGV